MKSEDTALKQLLLAAVIAVVVSAVAVGAMSFSGSKRRRGSGPVPPPPLFGTGIFADLNRGVARQIPEAPEHRIGVTRLAG